MLQIYFISSSRELLYSITRAGRAGDTDAFPSKIILAKIYWIWENLVTFGKIEAKFWKKWLNLGKFDWIRAKSNSWIPKTVDLLYGYVYNNY